MADLEKMKRLLALELPQVAIAAALGVSEGFVSQQMAVPEFIAEVAALRMAKLEKFSEDDARLDTIQSKVIEKLSTSVNYMLKPAELLGALKVISAIPRRSQVSTTGAAVGLSQTVNITLPNVVAVAFVKNGQGEIIEAGGRSLATLPSNVLKQMAAIQQKVPQQLQQQVRSNQHDGIRETARTQEFQTYEAAAT